MSNDPGNPLNVSLAERILQILRELVLTGEIPPGARVNEVELATRFGISRGPVREAIRHLTSEGLLVLRTNRGAYVPKADAEQVHALFELRVALEGEASRFAALRRTDEDIVELRRRSDNARAGFESGRRFPYRLDLDFHGALLQAARSPLITAQVHLVQQQVILLRTTTPVDPAHSAASLDDHDRLIEAIEAADPERAAETMRVHLHRVRDQLLTYLDLPERAFLS
ncbi:GntR family transcriptional regulator [Allokutzneria albata]|uniref:DNA-binding transcriptional regulator, GntR family n=1 Tax=Allokutzneria albata TaxID=211114 RepID=A0A1G9WSN0_ALLAB|nr:GntR family transcriptional regulator [Allokutzneria albata]SDM87136.1 DNA-binding transcriptional regulator, GntR family [Allokutzneria albata]